MKNINEKGITLIALVIAITVLISLAAVTAYAGKDTLESARLTKFTTEMKIMQYKLNDIYDAWKDGKKITINNEEKEATELGKDLSEVQTEANEVLVDFLHRSKDGYRYFDKDLLKELEIENVEQEFFVNVATRSVVSKDGVKYKNKWYYTLDDLPDNLYNVDYMASNKPTFDLEQEEINNQYQITIKNINYNGYINKWYVRYGLVENDGSVKTWHETQEMTFFIDKSGTYHVQIYNGTVFSEEEAIEIKVQNVVQGVVIPTGYTASTDPKEDEVSEGLVIRDEQGNEYVWIEVPQTDEVYKTAGTKITSFTNTEYTKIEKDLRDYGSAYNTTGGESGGDEWYAGQGSKIVTHDQTGLIDEQKALDNGCGLNYNDYYELKKRMLKSIYQNGGFWIGRYEAGIEGSIEEDADGIKATPRTSNTNTNANAKAAVSQQDKYPYNYVTCSQAQTLASNMKASGSEVTSSLMFGVQWNLVCKFIEKNVTTLGGYDNVVDALNKDSSKWGNYTGSTDYPTEFEINRGQYTTSPSTATSWKPYTTTLSGTVDLVNGKYMKKSGQGILLTTGASERNKVLNIYDFAGNEWEWTLEKTNGTAGPCTARGGCWSDIVLVLPASHRDSDGAPIYSNGLNASFRVTLY